MPGLDKCRDYSYLYIVSLTVGLMQYPSRDGLPNEQNRPDVTRATELLTCALILQFLMNLPEAFFE
jgi:hypothetical protein